MWLSLASGSSQTRERDRYLRLLDGGFPTTMRILPLLPVEEMSLCSNRVILYVVVPLRTHEPTPPAGDLYLANHSVP